MDIKELVNGGWGRHDKESEALAKDLEEHCAAVQAKDPKIGAAAVFRGQPLPYGESALGQCLEQAVDSEVGGCGLANGSAGYHSGHGLTCPP